MSVTAHAVPSFSRYQIAASVMSSTNPAGITYLLWKSRLDKLVSRDAEPDCSSILVFSREDQLFPSTPTGLRNFLSFKSRRIKLV